MICEKLDECYSVFKYRNIKTKQLSVRCIDRKHYYGTNCFTSYDQYVALKFIKASWGVDDSEYKGH